MKHFAYTATINGQQVALRSSADFGADVNGPATQTFNNYQDWRVVMMRFVPCGPSPAHNLIGKPQTAPVTSFDPAVCTPTMRLGVQPVFAPTAATGNAPAVLTKVGDYAMHLLYQLTPDESAALYHDLVAFRQACGDVTSGLPLDVHPCLVIEQNASGLGGPHAKQLQGIIQKYAHTFNGIAALATKKNTDPWLFMNGIVAGDSFVHQQIAAVTKDTGIHLNAHGHVLEPFSNGYYEMISFLNVSTGHSEDVDTANSSRITPVAVPTKTNTAITSADVNGVLSNDLYTRLNTIENPTRNDLFSTDCVSCHSASDATFTHLTSLVVSRHGSPSRASLGGMNVGGVFAAIGEDVDASALIAGVNGTDAFRQPGYTNIVDWHTVSRSNTNFPYNFVQFGYKDFAPAVSNRVANESAVAAYQANSFYNGGTGPAQTCATTEQMRSCLASPTMLNFGSNPQSGAIVDFAYCTYLLCPARNQALAPLFGAVAMKKYRARQDIPLTLSYASVTNVVVPKGTEVVGYRTDAVDYQIDTPQSYPSVTTPSWVTLMNNDTHTPLYSEGGFTIESLAWGDALEVENPDGSVTPAGPSTAAASGTGTAAATANPTTAAPATGGAPATPSAPAAPAAAPAPATN